MSENTNLPSSAAGNSDVRQSFWNGLLSDKGVMLLLPIGLLLILFSIVVIIITTFRPNEWLFHLNIYYWSFYPSIFFSTFLWITAIWLALESIDIAEDYQKPIKITVACCILLFIMYLLVSYYNLTGFTFWFHVVFITVAVCSAARSLLLLYNYKYKEKESIDLEEATWFWGFSGLFCTFLLIWGLMLLVSVRVQYHSAVEVVHTMPLYRVCYVGLQELVRQGHGPVWVYMLVLFTVICVAAFIYITGKWLSIVWSKIREE